MGRRNRMVDRMGCLQHSRLLFGVSQKIPHFRRERELRLQRKEPGSRRRDFAPANPLSRGGHFSDKANLAFMRGSFVLYPGEHLMNFGAFRQAGVSGGQKLRGFSEPLRQQ